MFQGCAKLASRLCNSPSELERPKDKAGQQTQALNKALEEEIAKRQNCEELLAGLQKECNQAESRAHSAEQRLEVLLRDCEAPKAWTQGKGIDSATAPYKTTYNIPVSQTILLASCCHQLGLGVVDLY